MITPEERKYIQECKEWCVKARKSNAEAMADPKLGGMLNTILKVTGQPNPEIARIEMVEKLVELLERK